MTKADKITFAIFLTLSVSTVTLFFLYAIAGSTKDMEIALVEYKYYMDKDWLTCEYYVKETIEGCEPTYYTNLLRVSEPNCMDYYGDEVRHKQITTNVLSPCYPSEPNFFIGILFFACLVIFGGVTIATGHNAFKKPAPVADIEMIGKR